MQGDGCMKRPTYQIPNQVDQGRINQREEGPLVITEFTYFDGDNWPLYANCFQRTAALDAARSVPVVILLHGGGPDHHSLIPLAKQLAENHAVILPDVRGYGKSVCTDVSLHNWSQYACDVIALMDNLSCHGAIIGGAGLGSTISLRAALSSPDRVKGLILISVEDIEDDNAKNEEIAFMENFAKRVKELGITKAWEPILPHLVPVIQSMVQEAIPRMNPESIAAAASIGYDRSFRSVDELASISVPTLIVPGMDWRHPQALAKKLSEVLPNGYLADVMLSPDIKNAHDFAIQLAPVINDFLKALRQDH